MEAYKRRCPTGISPPWLSKVPLGLGVSEELKVRLVQLVKRFPFRDGDVGEPIPFPAAGGAVARAGGEVNPLIHSQHPQQLFRVRLQGFQVTDKVILDLAWVAQTVDLQRNTWLLFERHTWYVCDYA